MSVQSLEWKSTTIRSTFLDSSTGKVVSNIGNFNPEEKKKKIILPQIQSRQ